ncbi:MAG TPA: hypothetical protein VFI61_00360 [Patescibacteria group bacterium]|nr:hypothetical protein [Patescibacteria group bacterium]
MGKHVKLTLLILLLVIAGSVFSIFYSLKNQPQNVPISQTSKYPLPVVNAGTTQTSTVVAPDGKWKLTMEEKKNKEGATYTFSLVDELSNSSKKIFTKTVPVGTTMALPLNTFSPDDKYFFIKETDSIQTRYFVLLASGQPIFNDSQTVEISELFMAKYEEYKITDITGWGGMNLLVVNVDKKEGGTGPSFWFDITNKSFIRLNDRFN